MFKVGDKVTTKNYGVCVISEILEKSFGESSKIFYALESLYKDSGKTMKVFIPVDKAEEQMRYVLSKGDVLALIDSFNDMQDIKITEFRARRNAFEELYRTGEIKKHCQLIKSLYVLDLEFKTKSKTLPYKDKEYFDKLKSTVYDEFANALEISPKEVEKIIGEKLAKQE